MKESALFAPMIEYLRNHGYDILEQHIGNQRGVDIIAAKNSKKFNLELKGDASAPDVDFGTAIYQIMKRMKDSPDEYAIGISEKYVKYAMSCEQPLKKLGIKVFVITDSSVKLLF